MPLRQPKFFVFLLAILTVALLPTQGSAHPDQARQTVIREIGRVLSGQSAYATGLSRASEFGKDLSAVLRRFPQVGTAKPVLLEGKTVKFLVPLVIDARTFGGFFQVNPAGTTIISFLVWDGAGVPLFRVERQKWDQAKSANELPELAELIPIKAQPSAGVPVEPEDIQDLFLIDHLGAIPSKTQEERKEHVDAESLKATLGRRTGSSKCLSYAAAMASDWWKTILGLPIGSYVSFVNGAREYGLNPRLLESLYFHTPASPYTFKKEAGKDRVTGETIPYSPKHYTYVMSWRPAPATIQDPLRKDRSYSLPEHGFGMDRPFFTVFNKSKGNVADIRQALQRYGILYAQHTSRLLNDKISLTLQGVHAVNIVGTGRLNGKDVVLYYETFGKNHRDYLEDSFYGPRLRAFPVGFFYQANAFPHQIRAFLAAKNGTAQIRFSDHLGRPLAPERVAVKINGQDRPVKVAAALNISPLPQLALVELRFARKYFYTPEEPEGYTRLFVCGNNVAIELGEYAAVVKALAAERKKIKTLFGTKQTSLGDFLHQREEKLRRDLLSQISAQQRDAGLFPLIAKTIAGRDELRDSDLGKAVRSMGTFHRTSERP
jgi:hypothetical protein